VGKAALTSVCGFKYKDTYKECAFMLVHSKIGTSSNYVGLNKQGAWFDSPLHFCTWLSNRRIFRQKKKLENKKLRKEIDREVKRNRWRDDADFRRGVVEKRRLHRNLNKDKTRAYASNYRKLRRKNHGIRLKMNARSRFGKVMKKIKGVIVTEGFNEFIGCSSAFLKRHIESQFEPWMNWDNYGPGWQMDHKIPLKHFDLLNPDQAKSAFHFSNLKPVSAAYNASKQARWSDV
jgi:hypothetical protein